MNHLGTGTWFPGEGAPGEPCQRHGPCRAWGRYWRTRRCSASGPRQAERTLVGDVGHLAEDREQLNQRLPCEIWVVNHVVGQAPIGAPIGLERMLVTTTGRPVRRPVYIEPADRADPDRRHVKGLGPNLWVVADVNFRAVWEPFSIATSATMAGWVCRRCTKRMSPRMTLPGMSRSASKSFRSTPKQYQDREITARSRRSGDGRVRDTCNRETAHLEAGDRIRRQRPI